jgi:predicted DNA binding CopG/RHH family protein
VPEFASEAEERAFRETHDTTGFVDWTRAKPVRLPNLKPSTTAISLRLPSALLERIKLAANQRDVPYQSLIRSGSRRRWQRTARRRPTRADRRRQLRRSGYEVRLTRLVCRHAKLSG